MSPDSIHPTPEELFAYRDGELPADRRVLIEAHVVGCHACRERIDSVSQLEAGLRQRPDQVEGDYYVRLSRSVLERLGAGGEETAAAAPPLQEPGAAPEEQPPEGVGTQPSTGPIRRDRRRAELPEEVRPSRAPRFPWPALISTVAAAAAVVVVVVMLFQQGLIHRMEKGHMALRAPGESVAPAPSTQPPAPAPPAQPLAPPGPSPPPAVPEQTVTTGEPAVPPLAKGIGAEAPLPQAPLAQGPPAQKKAADRTAERAGLARVSEEGAGRADQVTQRVARLNAAPAPPAGESTYGALLRRHGLPPLWEERRVSPQALRGAEPELRALYQTGRAGTDSASVRLYLAEAARLAYEVRPDSSLYDRIVHHYLRAIRLAGPDSNVGRIARERLQSFSR